MPSLLRSHAPRACYAPAGLSFITAKVKSFRERRLLEGDEDEEDGEEEEEEEEEDDDDDCFFAKGKEEGKEVSFDASLSFPLLFHLLLLLFSRRAGGR